MDSLLKTLEINDLLRLLPHRYPFLMIDKIVDIDGDDRCVGIKNVTYNESQFLGHFPNLPIFPGVFIIEGMAQSAGAICCQMMRAQNEAFDKVFFVTIEKCIFRKPVIPGDTLYYHMQKKRRIKNIWWFHGKAMVKETVVAEATVSAAIAKNE